MKFNGTTVKKRPKTFADLEGAIMYLKPDFVHTEMYITIKNGQFVYERKLNLIQGRKLFADPVAREILLNNVLH